ncbi:NHL repeat-containing protein, partial [Acrasis kona]
MQRIGLTRFVLLTMILSYVASADLIFPFVGNSSTLGYGGDNGLSTNAISNAPKGLIFNKDSNKLYYSDTGNNLLRVVDKNTNLVSTVVGATVGPALSAYVFQPYSVGVDPTRNLVYFGTMFTIHVLNRTSNMVTRVAGIHPYSGYSGDGGPAVSAKIQGVFSIVVDSKNNLVYFSDILNDVVRVINRTSGIITTFAGTTSGYSGDNGPASSAQFRRPTGLLLFNNILYVSDRGNHVIRGIDLTTNIVTTIYGVGISGFDGDGGPASNAKFNFPSTISYDSKHRSNYCVRAVNLTSNVITTVLGTPTSSGVPNDNVVATSNSYNLILGANYDPSTDSLYIVDYSNNIVQVMDCSTRIARNFAGTGNAGFIDNVLATSSEIYFPFCAVPDPSTNQVYIADYVNNVVRSVNRSSNFITTAVGNYQSTVDGYSSVAHDPVNNMIYFAMSAYGLIKVMNVTSNEIKSFAGIHDKFTVGWASNNVPSLSLLNELGHLAFDRVNNLLYIASKGGQVVQYVNCTTNMLYVAAGTSSPGYSGDNGDALSAQLQNPIGITIDNVNNAVYFSDNGNNVIRKINRVNNIITTIAGSGSPGFSGDGGLAVNAALNNPNALSYNHLTNILYISDTSNHVIRAVNITSGIITTVAGVGTSSGYSGDYSLPTNALLNSPDGLLVDSSRN